MFFFLIYLVRVKFQIINVFFSSFGLLDQVDKVYSQ